MRSQCLCLLHLKKQVLYYYFFFYMCYYTIMPDNSTTCYSNTSTRTPLLNREFFLIALISSHLFQVKPPLKDQGLKESEKNTFIRTFLTKIVNILTARIAMDILKGKNLKHKRHIKTKGHKR